MAAKHVTERRSHSKYYSAVAPEELDDAPYYGESLIALQSSLRLWKIVAVVELLIILLLIGAGLYLSKPNSCISNIHPLIPRDIIAYTTKVFTSSIPNDLSIYQAPPSPELDALWEKTYASSLFKVTGKETLLLPNATARLPDDPDGYVSMLTVTHNLHCLNAMRKSLYPEYYPEFNLQGNDSLRMHNDHCIDMLRQTAMCSPDTTPMVWQWNRKRGQYMVSFNVQHKCVDYDRIHEWVATRAIQDTYNASIWVEGNPVWGETP